MAYSRVMKLFALIAILVVSTSGYKFFQKRIPNGDKVINPCNGLIWEGVGHENRDGGGKRNPFGQAFEAEGKVWTKKVCEADSDGDGLTNGFELGDPDCTWKPGSVPSRTTRITHPGVCEPIDSPQCQDQFLKCNTKEFSCPAINSPDVKSINLTLPKNTPVPARETTYICTNLMIPADQLYDIIATRPLIDNRNIMHHMVVMGCSGNISDDEIGKTHECMMIDPRCNRVLDIWTFGMEGFCQPDYKAKRFGLGKSTWVSIQYHWNNPQKISDYTDHSGVQLFYTPKLRQYSESVMITGDYGIYIPPRTKKHVVEGTCSEEGSEAAFEKPFNISGLLLHMHYRGKRMWAKQYRNGSLIKTFADEQPFSYESPILYHYEDPIEVIPGDEIKVHCEYNTEKEKDWIYYGEGTQEEMCFAIFSYYPADEFKVDNCFSIGNKWSRSLGFKKDGCNMTDFVGKIVSDRDIIRSVCDVTSTKNCKPACYRYIEEFVNEFPECISKEDDVTYKHTYNMVLKYSLLYTKGKYGDLEHEIPRAFQACDLYPPTTS